jgi:hypothetical protein
MYHRTSFQQLKPLYWRPRLLRSQSASSDPSPSPEVGLAVACNPMRISAVGGGGSRPMELRTTAAQIDSTGTARARQIGGGCSHDYVWQK